MTRGTLLLFGGIAIAASTAAFSQLASDRFLKFPLASNLYLDGAYTAEKITSVLDHSLRQSSGNGFWQYGSRDGVIVAFNGEEVRGRSLSDKDPTCLKGEILLRADHNGKRLTVAGGCPAGYASYDEHPGYDYRASIGTPVYASAAGRVVNEGGRRCINSNLPGSCEEWGFLGIDHGNSIVTQYGHLSKYCLSAGAQVNQGQLIGYSGDKRPPKYELSPHLHFEVLYRSGRDYLVVDPYGWTGRRNGDPLYSWSKFAPRNLWSTKSTPEVRNPSCGR